MHDSLDVASTAFWCLVNAIAVRSQPLGQRWTQQIGVQIVRTDLRSEAWVNKCVTPRIRSSEGMWPEE